MYPAANPDPPLLAGVAALICALGGLGQGAERRGAAAKAGGGLRSSLRAPAGSWPAGRGAQPGLRGCLAPQRPAQGRNPGQYFFYVRAAFLLECSFADWAAPGMRVVSISPEVFYSWR